MLCKQATRQDVAAAVWVDLGMRPPVLKDPAYRDRSWRSALAERPHRSLGLLMRIAKEAPDSLHNISGGLFPDGPLSV